MRVKLINKRHLAKINQNLSIEFLFIILYKNICDASEF